MSTLPDHIRKAIPALGQNAAPENSTKIRELYAPLLAGVMDGVAQKIDVPYGDHERQKLDVYWKEGGAGKAVFVYIPGGGFVGGDKRSDELYYGNIGACAAKAGMVCVIANYRLAPEHKWPLASKDIESAIKWTKAHAKEFGGDPDKIVIMGHSAGAAHVATYLFDPDIKGERDVKGGLLSSGPYSVPKGPKPGNYVAYYGDDDSQTDRRSALNYVKDSKIPICISVAEYDPPSLITPAFDLARALVERSSTCPSIRCADGHNHFSTVASMGSSDDDFARFTLGFVKQCVGG